MPLTISLQIPTYWTPEQAFAVFELIDELRDPRHPFWIGSGHVRITRQLGFMTVRMTMENTMLGKAKEKSQSSAVISSASDIRIIMGQDEKAPALRLSPQNHLHREH
jgi:hypothetical protein